jgi:hypothetical protein
MYKSTYICLNNEYTPGTIAVLQRFSSRRVSQKETVGREQDVLTVMQDFFDA